MGRLGGGGFFPTVLFSPKPLPLQSDFRDPYQNLAFSAAPANTARKNIYEVSQCKWGPHRGKGRGEGWGGGSSFPLKICLCSLAPKLLSNFQTLSFLIPRMVYVPLFPKLLCILFPVFQFKLAMISSSPKQGLTNARANTATWSRKGNIFICLI